MGRDDDPVTGRRTLTESAYRDDRNIRSRTAIFAYAEVPADPGWRTSFVPWDGTQVVADVGCGSGFDLRQIVPDGRCRHAFALDLSAGMLRGLGALRTSGRVTALQADAQRLPLADGSVDAGLAMHMLYHVPDPPSAVRELRRVVRPGGMVLASGNSDGALSELNDLLTAAVSGQLGRPVQVLPPLGFTLESGGALLGQAFAEVSLHRRDVPLALPAAAPALGYFRSVQEPITRYVGEPFDFGAALGTVADRIEQVVRDQGSFRTVYRTGVFVCR